MNKLRISLFFIFVGIFAGVYQIGSMSTVSQEEADVFMSEFEELVMDIDGLDRKSTRLNSSHSQQSRMPSSA